MGRLLQVDTAAGTTLTNSTTETALASYVFPANFFTASKVIRFSFACLTASSNSTDTLTIKVNFGGTAVATSTAVDQANNDVCVVEGTITIRDADSSGTAVAAVLVSDPDANGTSADAFYASVGSLDFTGALTLSVSGTWSVAHADNQVASQLWVVEELA